MPLQNRDTLKGYFKKGQMPSEGHFNDLIDSMVSKVDDGLSKTIDEGLTLSPIGASRKLISFYKSIEDKNPAWSYDIESGNGTLNLNNFRGKNVLSLTQDGRVGVSTPSPNYELDVNGLVGMKGRMGTYTQGKVPGNGKWQTILPELNGCHAFEVVAGIGKPRTGKYSLIHAIAISTFGKSRNKIKVVQGYYGVRCNKLQLRWTGETYSFNLELRTRCKYMSDEMKEECNIQYYISSLWNDHFMENSVRIS